MADTVLFACTQNSVRSPMAAALLKVFRPDLKVESAGLNPGDPDHLMMAVMAELGHDLSHHHARPFHHFKPGHFMIVVTLSPEAHHRALEWARASKTPVEYWPTGDATATEGDREQRLAAYRAVRDDLHNRIKARFPPVPASAPLSSPAERTQ
jgi:protein-tyrosine-phosphatase